MQKRIIKLTPDQLARLEQKYPPELIEAMLALDDSARTAEHAAAKEVLRTVDPNIKSQVWNDISEMADENDPEVQLEKKLGGELYEFYQWLREYGAANIGQMCSDGPFEGQSTVYRYLQKLEDRGLIREVPRPPRPPRQWKVVEPDGV